MERLQRPSCPQHSQCQRCQKDCQPVVNQHSIKVVVYYLKFQLQTISVRLRDAPAPLGQ